MGRNFPDPGLDPKLTKEAQDVVDAAASSMDKWIDTNVERIKNEVKVELDAAANKLNEEVEALSKKHIAYDDSLNDIVNKLNGFVESGLKPVTPEVLQLMKDLKTLSDNLKGEIKKREDRWIGIGKKGVEIAFAAGKKFIGV